MPPWTVPPPEKVSTPEIPPPTRGWRAPKVKIPADVPYTLVQEEWDNAAQREHARYWNDHVQRGIAPVDLPACQDTQPPPPDDP